MYDFLSGGLKSYTDLFLFLDALNGPETISTVN